MARPGARAEATGRTLVLAFFLLAFESSPAFAQIEVAVVSLALDGELAEDVRDEALRALESGLRPAAARVSWPAAIVEAAALSGSDLEPASCTAESCLVEAARAVGADAAMRGRFAQLGQIYSVELVLHAGSDGEVLATVSLDCDVCAWSEALETLVRAARGLAGSLPGALSLSLSPPDAAATVDGAPTGAGRLVLAPGRHLVEASAPGHATRRREVTIVAGALVELALELEPDEPEPPPVALPTDPPPRRVLTPWAWATAGAGVAALVPGVLWLALEGRCARGSPQEAGLCRDVYFTWPQGLAASLVGAGLLATSVALFVLERRARRAAAAPALALAASPTGASAVLSGRF